MTESSRTSTVATTLWGTMLYVWMLLASHVVVAVGLIHVFANPSGDNERGVLVLVVTVLNPVAYWFSNQVALVISAKEVNENRGSYIWEVVSEQARHAGLPEPRVIESRLFVAAFATGRDPRHAVLGVSPTLQSTLDRREFGAVIAHEVAHLRNRDSLLGAVVMTLVGGVLATSMLLGLSKMSMAIVLLPAVVSWILEWRADTTAARLSGDRLALASALNKLPRSSFASFLFTLPLHTHLPTKLRVWYLQSSK